MMDRTPFQSFCDDGIRKTYRSMTVMVNALIRRYDSLYKEVASLLRAFYADYASSTGYKSMMDWGMGTGSYEKLRGDVESLYRERSEEIDNDVVSLMRSVVIDSFGRMTYALAWLASLLGFSVSDMRRSLPDVLVDLSTYGGRTEWEAYEDSDESDIYGDPSIWMPRHDEVLDILQADRDEQVKSVLESIALSIMTGRGIRASLSAIKDRICRVTRTEVAGRKVAKVKGAAAVSAAIARTEGGRMLNVGLLASSFVMRSAGYKPKKMWLAVIDSRTRQQSLDMDGQTVDIDKSFVYPNGATSMYPGNSGYPEYDVNDRCSCTILVPDDSMSLSSGVDPVTGEEGGFSWTAYSQWDTV